MDYFVREKKEFVLLKIRTSIHVQFPIEPLFCPYIEFPITFLPYLFTIKCPTHIK